MGQIIKEELLTALGREELTAHLDRFLNALTTRQSPPPGLASDARYTENGVELPLGEGLWATADKMGRYRHDFLDAVSGQAACFATVWEGKTHSIMSARIKVAEDAVTEAEVVIARPDLGGGGPFPDGPRSLDESGAPDPAWFEPIPEAERTSREELRRIANLYFAGLEKNDGKGEYPFADDCVRIENGELVTAEPKARDGGTQRDTRTPYRLDLKAMSAREQFESGFFAFVDRIRERRFPLVDEERGIVFTFAFFEHSGTVREYTLADGTPTTAGLDRPFTWMIAEAFRIERGLFTRIEALMTAVPYGHRSGWPTD